MTYRGRPVTEGPPRSLRWFRREVQVVLQDPFASLDPRMRVADIMAEPLQCLGIAGEHRRRTAEVLGAVGLDQDVLQRYPHEFSGGQRQSIAIARALAPAPRVLVAGEPLSALDVAVRVQVMELLRSLAADLGLALVPVSHDIGASRGCAGEPRWCTTAASSSTAPRSGSCPTRKTPTPGGCSRRSHGCPSGATR